MQCRYFKLKAEYPLTKREIFENNMGWALHPAEPRYLEADRWRMKQNLRWQRGGVSPFMSMQRMRRFYDWLDDMPTRLRWSLHVPKYPWGKKKPATRRA